MNPIAFTIGMLSGSVLTFAFVSIVMRSASKNRADSILEFQREANALLEERNAISRRQLALMEKGAAQ